MAKQPVILRVGYQGFLLPDDSGVTTVIRTLSKAIACRDRTWSGEVVILKDQTTEIALHAIPRGTEFVYEDPEQAPAQDSRGLIVRKHQPRLKCINE
jgi:hypothetical protein